MPVSWQMGPVSSTAMSMLDKIISSAWEDCVSGVSSLGAMDMAARTSGGRLVDVCVISSSKLPARNSISLPPQLVILHFFEAYYAKDWCGWWKVNELDIRICLTPRWSLSNLPDC